MKEIADTGLIVALLFRNDPFHAWAQEAFRKHAPFLTCDPVLTEAASFCPDPVAVLKLVTRGDLILDPDFSLDEEASHLASLAAKYADRPMDLADACLVRMSERHPRCRIWTVDRNDFATYRRLGRRAIPCEFPPAG
ncbi:type II toxin-antitoxin system VapC family toxin [Haloferula sp. A504]|uniref:type II toxin-antitoxin system VapC family toxin n=1 Tax=Haloferula sp. A504 TaxID=3373601 RepID=UPI0031C7E755|nr:PIN domain-containing protein [Verrucomicrobiaceae bacterium E54]